MTIEYKDSKRIVTSADSASYWDFDGTNDYVQMPTIPTGYTFAVSMWVRKDTSGRQAFMVDNDTNGIWLEDADAGSTRLRVGHSQSGSDFDTSTGFPVDSNFHHLVFNVGTPNQIWLDGVSLGTGGSANSTSTNWIPAMGARNSSGTIDRFLNGAISKVGIWDRKLTDAEVASLYAEADPSTISSGLLATYNFEQTGNTLEDQTNSYDGTNNGATTGGTRDVPETKPNSVQDNSILVEKDTARRYWRTPASSLETESSGSYTWDGITASADNNRQGFHVATTSSAVYGKTINSVSFWLKRQSNTSGTAYCRVWSNANSGGTGGEVHEFGSIALSALTTDYVKYTFSTGSHTLALYDTVGMEFTGSISDGIKMQGSLSDVYDSTDTIRGRTTNGNGTLSPYSGHDMRFAITETIPATWTMEPTLEYDLSTSAGWTTTGSNCSVNTSGQYLEGSSSTNNDRATKALGLTLSDTKFVVRQKMELTTVTTGGNGQLYFGYTDKDNSTTVLGNRDAIGITIRTGADFLQSYALNQAWQSSATLSTTPTATTYYLELIRNSATSYTLNLYSDSNYSVLVETKTNSISLSVNGLNHITIGGWDNNASGVITARFSDIQIYNGVSTVN